MGQSTAIGHMGLMWGLLALIIMVYGMARSLASPALADGAFEWSVLVWVIGYAFMIWERYDATRGP